MKKRIYILSIVSFLSFNATFSQKAKIKSAVKQYEKLSYADSKSNLLSLANKGNTSLEVIEKLANAYYFNNEMQDASKWYSKLIEGNTNIESENFFRYAQTLKAQENYEEANKIMLAFATMNPQDSRAKKILSSTNYLKAIEELSEDFELNNLDINTPYSDFGTSTYQDNLVFASSRDKDEKIYSWNAQPFLDLFELNKDGSIKEILGNINTKYHESSAAFTKDGNTVYFTRNNYYKGNFKKNSNDFHTLKIYKATLVEGKWTNIESLPFNNSEYSVAHPALSTDEKKLYFASDMPGTYGASDIFVVDIHDDGSYGEPINLGAKINTESRENFPFISEKNILYFSSDGHLGLGGLDVFKIETKNIESGVIQNLGKPINSPKDDFAYVINETTRKGYISSNRTGGKGDDDIYSFIAPECSKQVSGTLINKKTQEVLEDADLVIYDGSNKIIKSLKTDNSGKFQFNLTCKQETYTVEAKKEDYNDTSTNFSTKKTRDIVLTLALEPEIKAAEVGTDLFKLLNLKPIYFDYDKSIIRPDAQLELEKIINYMNEFPSVKIDVRSHTDSRGKDAYNFALSNRRNKSTIKFIVEKGGISKNRLTGKGYGETKLVNKCKNGVKCTKEEHQKNRRSEFIVVAN